MKRILEENEDVRKKFRNIVMQDTTDSDELLTHILGQFLKCKQNQLVAEYGLGSSKSSQALTTSLQQQS